MTFKVFDLQCERGHVFEGWFSSHSDFDTQRERGLISCPLCDSKTIDKKPSAPMLNVSGSKEPGPSSRAASKPAAMQAAMLQHLRQLLRQTENVGERFAAEARRIHHGEAPERPIRGVATYEEQQSLVEEGIPVAAIPALLDDERLQ
ncbi:DUF1178 family protein [Pigmentiphaga sp.]|jgi:Uncharacterized protein conserved in bacteria|uniref:DUF1178 family protein n=1 Tax=Pigmentiphaga sp. TaxID=1977564 RepID=UPI0025DF0E1A|nr:DUF1178 family protein [Pigmentiphaga sp.]MBX6317861.1 DUF1178 family protein [Pigmentiphaga sp.]